MAAKKKKVPAPVAEITDAEVQAKRAQCGFQLSAHQCRQVLEAQAAHDATDPHDEAPAVPAADETGEA